jgi:hypothetical protein
VGVTLSKHAVVFAATKRPILFRQKQWNEHNKKYDKASDVLTFVIGSCPINHGRLVMFGSFV